MTSKGDSTRRFQIVPPGGGEAPPPAHYPSCPAYLSETQRVRFFGICERLDREDLLAHADVGDIQALAIAEDNLETSTREVNANGKYVLVTKQGRPYQCPACKGSGLRPIPKSAQRSAPPAAVPAPSSRAHGRPCSVCSRPDRAAIDQALTGGESFGSVSKRHGISKAAAYRHKMEHLGGGERPGLVLVDPVDPTCLGCRGTGIVIPVSREVSEKRPETTDQRYAIDHVAMLSNKLGLDVTSRVRVKGKVKEQGGKSALADLLKRRAR